MRKVKQLEDYPSYRALIATMAEYNPELLREAFVRPDHETLGEYLARRGRSRRRAPQAP